MPYRLAGDLADLSDEAPRYEKIQLEAQIASCLYSVLRVLEAETGLSGDQFAAAVCMSPMFDPHDIGQDRLAECRELIEHRSHGAPLNSIGVPQAKGGYGLPFLLFGFRTNSVCAPSLAGWFVRATKLTSRLTNCFACRRSTICQDLRSGAVHRDQFATGCFDGLFGRFVATDCGIIHDTVEGLRRVLSPVKQKCMVMSSRA
jgi:hypothetical protein